MKISVLGAGSSTFALKLIMDFCLTPSLKNSEICFMDIDEKRLDASHGMCVRLAKEMDAPLTITKTTSREEALIGSSYVINTILIGGHQHMADGWEIALKHGYDRGGSLHILHDEAFWINFYQLRMMEDILLDIKRLCPDAWYLMVANPVMAATTYFRRKYPEVKFIGLCHGTNNVRRLAEALKLDMSKVTTRVPGVNHYVWLNEFYYDGKDVFPMLDQYLEEHAKDHPTIPGKSNALGPKSRDLYRRYGVYPIGDTANAGGGSWGYEYHSDKEVEKSWEEDPKTWYEGYFQRGADRLAQIEKAAYDQSASIKELIPCEKSLEPMVPLIESLETGIEHVIVLNVMNDREYVQGVPKDFQVEIPCLCGAFGVSPMPTKPLPKPIIARCLRDRIAPVEMELAAFEAQSKELLIDLIMMDPRSRSWKQAEAFVNEILDMPCHKEMKEWYK